jgi:hypothetical protein
VFLTFRKGVKMDPDRESPWVLLGCPRKLKLHQRRKAIPRRDAGETLMDIARSYNVSHYPTISRL